jgi:hypothetical protein
VGNLINFLEYQKKILSDTVIEKDFTTLFKSAVQDKKNHIDVSVNEGANIVIQKPNQFAIEFQAKINTFLLEEKLIASDLFRCAIYIARMIEKMFTSVPMSYYVIDYYTAGQSQQNPSLFLEGGDFCCMLCIFFPERGNRRSMKLQDYEHIGAQMYYRYHEVTKNTIGLCMGDNFNNIVAISKECLQEL